MRYMTWKVNAVESRPMARAAPQVAGCVMCGVPSVKNATGAATNDAPVSAIAAKAVGSICLKLRVMLSDRP
ncbi:hypothetical protein D3C87_1796350 [compost metagenome]